MGQDDFFLWLDSPEGQLSEKALFEVMDSLESCSADPQERVIVWDDGKRLSITQTARRIHKQSKLPLQKIESHVVGWLQMHYEPQGLSEQQMDDFENMIDVWIQEYQNSQQAGDDSA
jgi:hypothetical protein